MAEVFNVQLLQNELPDSSQHLAKQTPVPQPRKFACFADLTIEVRLEIWNLTFPARREIKLLPHKFKCPPNLDLTKCHCLPSTCTHHPVALFINHESRSETLRHYRCLLRDKLRAGKRDGAQIIYFRPGQDVLYISSDMIWKVKPYNWVSSFQLHNSELFANLKSLEIWYWDWQGQMKESFLTGQAKVLGMFPALEVLTVYLSPWFQLRAEEEKKTVDRLDLPATRESERALRKHFEGLAEREPGRKMPRIVMEKAENWK